MLGEQERCALAASPGPWRVSEDGDEVIAVDDITVAEAFALSGNQVRTTADHIALNDPAFVLADIASKRAILEECAEALIGATSHETVESCDEEAAILAERTMRRVATSFAGQPGFDPRWTL